MHDMHASAEHSGGLSFDPKVVVIFAGLIVFYISAILISNRRLRKWPAYRVYCWSLGISSAALAVDGPIADRANAGFSAHMTTHLLLGMLAPLLVALAAPVTLLLRTIPISTARRFSRIMNLPYFRFLANPSVAALNNTGGLWILYTTGLYEAMHHNHAIYVIVHIHLFLSGYIFTVAMIYWDPIPHRFSFKFRSLVLILAIAGHDILSKMVYIAPPEGVPIEQAEAGSQLMYYGGGFVEGLLIVILCFQWYEAECRRSYSESQRI